MDRLAALDQRRRIAPRPGPLVPAPGQVSSAAQPERDRNGIDVDSRQPRRLVAIAMQFAMLTAADSDRIFVAGLSSERAGLGKTKMVRVGRCAAARPHTTGLRARIWFVAQAMVFACMRGPIRAATNFIVTLTGRQRFGFRRCPKPATEAGRPRRTS